MKNFILAIIITFGIQTTYSQVNPEKTWVTVENIIDLPTLDQDKLISTNSELQSLIEEFHIISFEQALYSSRRANLLKVYEIECFCDVLDLEKRITETSTVLSNPQPAPEYDFMAGPDDYLSIFPSDYALDLINAREAWEYSEGDTNVIVGISDGNYYLAHEEIDNEFVTVNVPSYTPASYYNHGTAVAVTAAGRTNNGEGKSSIGYNCRLALAGLGYNYVMQLAYDGVPVINMSWASGCSYNSYLQGLVNEMYDYGTILVAAAGNGGTCGGPNNLVYPAAFSHVISVTSIGPEDNHEKIIGDPTTTHQHNSTVDLAAPGYLVGITVAPGYYQYGNGTSFAAPYVTGTIGLMLSVAPCLTFEDVEQILKETSTNIDAQNPSYIGKIGAGRLDAEAALAKATDYCGTVTDPVIEDTLIVSSTIGILEGNGENEGIEINEDSGNESPDIVAIETSGVSELEAQKDSKEESLGFESVSIDHTAFEAQLYPNPATGDATIVWDLDENTMIRVVNLLGEVILIKEVNKGTSSIKLSFTNPGVYLVSLEQAGREKWLGKLVKM
jgi:hypothetical protein